MKLSEMEAVIEAILFISGEAVPLGQIAGALRLDKATTKALIEAVREKYTGRGIQIVELGGSYQMCTSPNCFEYIRDMYQSNQKQGLSQTLLETLAIISYKQPVTKAMIEEIRGVNADHAINKLMERNLICETGRLNTPGRPVTFGTTEEFLRYFGYKSIQDLPPLDVETEESEEAE